MTGLRISTGRSRSVACLGKAYATLAEPAIATALPKAAAKTGPSDAARAERTLRRFWKSVDIETVPEGLAVRLDRRNLRTPSGRPLILPLTKPALTTLIAHEWDSQDKILKQHSLPLTSLASRAIDGLSTPAQRDAVIDDLLAYLDTDTVCFHESKPAQLVRLQDEHWTPLLHWVNERYNVDIQPYEEWLGGKQTAETHKIMADTVRQYDPYKLAAFERAVMASKSFIISLALVDGFYTAEQAALSAHVEVSSQIEQWGEVEDTHDVDHQDIRARLGSAAIAVIDQD